MRSSLAILLHVDTEDLRFDLSILHERVCFEAVERLKSNPAKPEKLEAILKMAVKAALDEFRDMPLASEDPDSQELAVETPPSQHIDTIVQSDEFREQYINRLEKASKGDLTHLRRFIQLLAKRITHSTVDEHKAARLFLYRARDVYCIPDNEHLWVRICESFESTDVDGGTERAT